MTETEAKEIPTHVVLIGSGVLACLVAIGLGIGFGLVPMLRARRAAQWPEVAATVRSAELEEAPGGEGCFRPVITYAYAYEGRDHTSRRYDFVDAYDCEGSTVRDIVARHPPGSRVSCFVDPNEPSYAVLNRSAGEGLIPLVMCAGALVMGLGVAAMGYRRRPR
jgi:hypothetical protein